jgi:HK97 family phage major capsid protein
MNNTANPHRSDSHRKQRLLELADLLTSNRERTATLDWPDQTAEQRALAPDLMTGGPGVILSLADQLRPHAPTIAAGIVQVVRRDQFQSETMPIIDRSLLAEWGQDATPDLFDDHGIDVAEAAPRRVSAFVRISDQLARQSPLMGAIFAEAQLLAAVSGAIERAVLQGTGDDGQPLGLALDDSLPSVTATATAPAVAYADLVDMEEELCDNFEELSASAWLASPDIRKGLRSTAAPANAAWAPSPVGPLGRPVIASAHAPAGFLCLAESGAIVVPLWRMSVESLISREEAIGGWKTLLVTAWCDVSVARPGAVVKLVEPEA